MGDGRNVPLGIVITRIENYHDTKFGVLWIASGQGLDENLHPMLDKIEHWFRAQGCTRCEVDGRKGWQKVLNDYTLQRVVLVKELR